MKKYITVFFNGTGHAKDNPSFLANWLHGLRQESEQQLFMNFDGIGVVSPLMGTLFGTGMDKQCEEVISKVRECIEAGDEVVLNIYGHSRGGISALMLAKQLSNINPSKLSIHLALHDPVPGNLLSTRFFDAWDITLANKFMDLSMCKPLKKVLALYPHKPLNASEWSAAFHAPLFPDYPKHTEVEEIIIPGCHAGAQYQGVFTLNDEKEWFLRKPETREEFLEPHFYNSESYIAFRKIALFLQKQGSCIESTKKSWYPGAKDYISIRDAYEIANKKFQGTIYRYGHSNKGRYIDTQHSASYFNDHHQSLTSDSSLSKHRAKFKYSSWFISNMVRDLILSMILATGFSALIFLTSPLGLGFSIAIGLGLTALCMSPIAKKGAERFFYPHYQVRNFDQKENNEISLRASYA